ncbi:MAG: GNAT family N-acetyltransferase [Haloarculaceae archaeon]
MADATVRPARAEEAAAVRAVGRAAWHAAYDPIHGPETVEELFDSWWTVEDLREGAEDPERVLLVAARDGDVLGVADAGPDPEHEGAFVVARLYVHPDAWEEGLGTRLVDGLRERLPGDVGRLRLVVLAENDVGVSFYESYGFERVAERVEEHGGETHEEYVYELSVR